MDPRSLPQLADTEKGMVNEQTSAKRLEAKDSSTNKKRTRAEMQGRDEDCMMAPRVEQKQAMTGLVEEHKPSQWLEYERSHAQNDQPDPTKRRGEAVGALKSAGVPLPSMHTQCATGEGGASPLPSLLVPSPLPLSPLLPTPPSRK